MVNSVLQWAGTASLLCMYITMNFFRGAFPLEVIFGLIGGLCYLTWSFRVANKPQIIVNSAGVIVCVFGLINFMWSM